MKKLNKKNLSKLVFWVMHIVAVGAILVGLVMSVFYSTMEKNYLALHNDCYEKASASTASYCGSFFGYIDSYGDTMFGSFALGIFLLSAYWGLGWLYGFLFAEEVEQEVIAKKQPTKEEKEEIAKQADLAYKKAGFIVRLFKGRLGRLDYFIFIAAALTLVSIVSAILLVTLSELRNNMPLPLAVMIAMFFCYAFVLFFNLSAHTKRLHDMDMPAYWIIGLLVPFLGFVLILMMLFKKGTDGANKFGMKNDSGTILKRILGLGQTS